MADKSKKGMVYPPCIFEVEKGKIAEFAMAAALKDQKKKVNPLYVDAEAARKAGYKDIICSPTFPTAFAMWGRSGGLSALIDPVGIDLARLLHGGEEYEYFGSIHPGDVLTIYTRVADIYEREKKGKPGKSMEFTVFESEMKNQKGELVVKSRTIFIER